MGEKKYIVPDGMLKAACEVFGNPILDDGMVRKELEAALYWLAEHPIVPSDDQIYDLFRECRNATHRWDECSWEKRHRDILCEWQRVAFIAPEEPFDATLGGALNGRTWTQEQADALIENIRTATHGYVNPLDKQINETIHNIDRHMATDIYRYGKAPEPGVPEAIKDLILPDIESGFFKPEILNARLVEAYRLGRNSKEIK